MYKASFGVDYKEYMNKPWNERVKMVTGTDPTQSSSQGGSQGGGSNTVTMQAPNGKQYTFSADQAEEARKNGWK